LLLGERVTLIVTPGREQGELKRKQTVLLYHGKNRVYVKEEIMVRESNKRCVVKLMGSLATAASVPLLADIKEENEVIRIKREWEIQRPRVTNFRGSSGIGREKSQTDIISQGDQTCLKRLAALHLKTKRLQEPSLANTGSW